MKTTVEKLIAELTDLRVEEKELQKRIDDNRRRQAALVNSLQVKPGVSEPERRPRKLTGRPNVLASLRPQRTRASSQRVAGGFVRRSSRTGTMTSSVAPTITPANTDRPAAARIREHIESLADGASITTEDIAKTLGIEGPTASTALSRLTGKLIEREPGTKRGKFRKINRAA